MSDRQPLATPEEVAEYMRKPVRTLEQWRYRGVGPRWVKVGGRHVRYRWEDIDAYVEQSRTAA